MNIFQWCNGYLEPSIPLLAPVIFHAALPTPTSREKSSGEADRHRVDLIYYNFFLLARVFLRGILFLCASKK